MIKNMEMNTKKAAIILTVLVVLTACTNGDGSSELDSGFIGGTQGLSMEFVSNAPPDEIIDRGQMRFNVLLDVRNLGEASVAAEDVNVELKGFSGSEFGVSSENLTQHLQSDIEGERRAPGGTVIAGGRTQVEYPEFNFSQRATTGRTVTFQADACYSYGSQAVSRMCILEELFQVGDDAFCDVENRNNQISSSGAPIQVTGVSQVPGSNRINFEVQIENRGDGQVYAPGSSCSGSQTEDRVSMSLGGLPEAVNIDCLNAQGDPQSEEGAQVRLNTGQEGPSTVNCVADYDQGGLSDRFSELEIELNYDYRERISKDVQLRRTLD